SLADFDWWHGSPHGSASSAFEVQFNELAALNAARRHGMGEVWRSATGERFRRKPRHVAWRSPEFPGPCTPRYGGAC
ncbi:MAG: hypothetical protein ACKV22_01560, partial [Bryobacteraceae bacterium]